MTIQESVLETTVDVRPEGLRLSVRGELSSATAPALRSLIEALCDTRERVVQLDLRDAIRSAGADRVLERWGLTAGEIAGVYFLP